MFKPVRTGGWWVTVPAAVFIVPAARGGRDYWYLDRMCGGPGGQQIAIRNPGDS
jgi:hypothetical protein